MTEKDKWLFKIIGYITFVITVMIIVLLVTGHQLDFFDFIKFYSFPLGIMTGWGVVVLLENKKKK